MDPLSQSQNQNDDLSSTNNAESTANSSSETQSTAELDNLMNELNNYRPENDELASHTSANSSAAGRPEFTPSQGLVQTATISAAPISSPNTESVSSPLAPESPVDTSTSNNSQNLSDVDTFKNQASTNPVSSLMDSIPINPENIDQEPNGSMSSVSEESTDDSDDQDQPLQAAAPVPGSIGSAVSYADVEKKQAEEALKQAKNQGKPKFKFTLTTILIIVVVVLIIVSGAIVALIFLNQPKNTPTEATGKNQVAEAATKTLTCVRPLSTNEAAEVSASYGNFERQFVFNNNNLDTISENYIYQYDSSEAATAAKATLESAPKTDSNSSDTISVNVNQLRKTLVISNSQLDSYLNSQSELSSVTNRDLNGFLAAENQSGLSCSTIE